MWAESVGTVGQAASCCCWAVPRRGGSGAKRLEFGGNPAPRISRGSSKRVSMAVPAEHAPPQRGGARNCGWWPVSVENSCLAFLALLLTWTALCINGARCPPLFLRASAPRTTQPVRRPCQRSFLHDRDTAARPDLACCSHVRPPPQPGAGSLGVRSGSGGAAFLRIPKYRVPARPQRRVCASARPCNAAQVPLELAAVLQAAHQLAAFCAGVLAAGDLRLAAWPPLLLRLLAPRCAVLVAGLLFVSLHQALTAAMPPPPRPRAPHAHGGLLGFLRRSSGLLRRSSGPLPQPAAAPASAPCRPPSRAAGSARRRCPAHKAGPRVPPRLRRGCARLGDTAGESPAAAAGSGGRRAGAHNARGAAADRDLPRLLRPCGESVPAPDGWSGLRPGKHAPPFRCGSARVSPPQRRGLAPPRALTACPHRVPPRRAGGGNHGCEGCLRLGPARQRRAASCGAGRLSERPHQHWVRMVRSKQHRRGGGRRPGAAGVAAEGAPGWEGPAPGASGQPGIRGVGGGGERRCHRLFAAAAARSRPPGRAPGAEAAPSSDPAQVLTITLRGLRRLLPQARGQRRRPTAARRRSGGSAADGSACLPACAGVRHGGGYAVRRARGPSQRDSPLRRRRCAPPARGAQPRRFDSPPCQRDAAVPSPPGAQSPPAAC